MKILCVIDSLGSGGAQRQLVELALGFKEQGHAVSFLTYHSETFYNHFLEKAGIHICCIQEPNYIKRLLKMRRYIRQGEYNAVLSFLDAPNFICEIAGLPFRKWKLIVGERSANTNIKKSLKLKTYRWFHLLASYVVTNSHANMKIIRSINPLLSASKCKVIYNIVDFDKWKPKVVSVPGKGGCMTLVVAASHQYNKNLNGLVEAVNALTDAEKSRLKIEWYGDRIEEPYRDDSFQEAQTQIKSYRLEALFHFYPATHNLDEIFQDCDAIGLFSKHEGLPNVICEGMACAKPVICTAVSDLPIFLSHCANLLIAPSDIESMKKTISHILTLGDEDMKIIGEENRMIAKNNFGRSDKILDYLSLMTL